MFAMLHSQLQKFSLYGMLQTLKAKLKALELFVFYSYSWFID